MKGTLFFMAVALAAAGAVDGQELSGEGKPEFLGGDRMRLEFTNFHTPPLFLHGSDLRGKRRLR